MLLFSKIYTSYSTKVVFLSAIGLFEIGSAICGAATSSKAFIVGRAIAGWGSAGIFGGAIVITVHTVCIFSCALLSIPAISGVIKYGLLLGICLRSTYLSRNTCSLTPIFAWRGNADSDIF
jgi:MFS family permease